MIIVKPICHSLRLWDWVYKPHQHPTLSVSSSQLQQQPAPASTFTTTPTFTSTSLQLLFIMPSSKTASTSKVKSNAGKITSSTISIGSILEGEERRVLRQLAGTRVSFMDAFFKSTGAPMSAEDAQDIQSAFSRALKAGMDATTQDKKILAAGLMKCLDQPPLIEANSTLLPLLTAVKKTYQGRKQGKSKSSSKSRSRSRSRSRQSRDRSTSPSASVSELLEESEAEAEEEEVVSREPTPQPTAPRGPLTPFADIASGSIFSMMTEDQSSGFVTRRLSGRKAINLGACPELSAKLEYELDNQVIQQLFKFFSVLSSFLFTEHRSVDRKDRGPEEAVRQNKPNQGPKRETVLDPYSSN